MSLVRSDIQTSCKSFYQEFLVLLSKVFYFVVKLDIFNIWTRFHQTLRKQVKNIDLTFPENAAVIHRLASFDPKLFITAHSNLE